MKNNGTSYAERKRISLKIERNNSMNSNQNNKSKKESNANNKIIHKTKIKRLSSYKEPPFSTNQHHKENTIDKEKFKENFLFKKISLNNEALKNKPSKTTKNNNSIGALKQIDLNINLNNNNQKVYNGKSSIDYDDKAKKFKHTITNHMNESNYNDIRLNNKASLNSKKKKIMNNSYCSSNKDINKIINSSNNNNFISITSKSSRKNNEDILNIQDEILELKLLNSRANNEIIILKEKNNSLKEVIDMKEKEMQLIKKKYLKMIDEANDEQIKIKNKLENEYKSLQKNYDISIRSIKSLLETVIELTETIIYNEKNHNNIFYNNCNSKNITNNFNQISFSGAADCSLDMYESNMNFENNNNREEDKENKRNILLEQIKEIIIEKINNITHKLNLVLDSSFLEKIERLNNWNFHNFNVKFSPNYSFNLYNLQKRNNINQNTTCNLNDELFSGSLSKYNMSLNNEVSNDFDFSVSKSFYNPSSNISASPKFNRSIKVESNHISTNGNGNVKSLLFSFDEVSKNNVIKDKNKLNNTGNNNLNGNNHIFNILEYSMVDLVNSGEYASSNIHNIININNTVNNNNFTESKDNNFKGFYESFSNSNSKNKFSSKDRIKNENNNININNNLFIDSVNENNGEIKNEGKENSDIGNITLKDIEQ